LEFRWPEELNEQGNAGDPCILIENMVLNPDFDGEIDFGPFQEYDEAGNHGFQNFMSRN
jgi:hypothetical protein